VLLVFEDLHWADEASLELLATLARDSPALPVLLLLTYRPEDAHPGLPRLLASLERERLATEFPLPPLGLGHVETMIRLILDLQRSVPAELLHVAYRLTEGNPFFVEEILRSLPETAVTGGDRGTRTVAPVPVPRTVQEAVQRRVEALGEAARGVLEVVRIAELELDEPRTDEVLVRIVAAGICHTDLSTRDEGRVPLPAVLGHEGLGSCSRWVLT